MSARALRVYTARITYSGADRLDVSRMGVDRATAKGLPAPGVPWAPSWRILRPMLVARDAGRAEEHWPAYVEAYRAELRASWTAHRVAWAALLARDEVTLLCFCTDPSRCHRTVLAEVLVSCGAVYVGEREVCCG